MMITLKARPVGRMNSMLESLRRAALVLALGAVVCPCLGQEAVVPDITASADKHTITVGDILEYRVQVTCPAGTEVGIPEAEKKLAPFELRGHDVQREEDDGKLRVTFSYEVAIFEVGERELQGLEVEYRAKDAGESARVSVPAVTITVASVLPADAKDIKDIRDPAPVKMGREQWVAAGLVALVVLLVLAVAALLIRRRRRRLAPPTTLELISAQERALRELAELENGELLSAGEAKAYCTRLSEIVREYLEARFQVRAMEQTTWMIGLDLDAQGVERELREALVGLLRRADLVKFARQELGDAEAIGDLEEARRIIVACAPREADAPEEAKPSAAE